MSRSINRRHFFKSSAVLAAAAGVHNSVEVLAGESNGRQEYYEIRTYKTTGTSKMKMVNSYLEHALIPALKRMGLDRIGVFTNMDDSEDYSTYVLIPFPALSFFAELNTRLHADTEYLKSAQEFFTVPKDDPQYTRIHSSFFKAFKGIPVIEMPEQTAGNKPRIFEIRIYESHTEEKAALKVDMFNSGEIQVMRDTQLGPVFFGEALIGDNLPNLTYMLSASNREEHNAHWDKFRVHPEWERMKVMPKYKDTVSNITKIFLKPTSYSQI